MAQIKVREWRRKQLRVPTPFDNAFIESVTKTRLSISAQLDARSEYLEECMSELPDEDRDLLSRRYEPASNVKAIAHALDRSTDHIYRRLNRVHESLRRCMSRKSSGDSAE